MQAQRDAAKQLVEVEPTPVAWPIPPEEEWDFESGSFAYHLSATARLTARVGRVDKRLVFFAIMLDCERAGVWTNIWRVDCKHDAVHRHEMPDMGERTVIRPITSQNDVEITYEPALAEVERHWPEIERGWQDGRPYRTPNA
jgi:hypothetical protein